MPGINSGVPSRGGRFERDGPHARRRVEVFRFVFEGAISRLPQKFERVHMSGGGEREGNGLAVRWG